jgi:hypothetical protein
VVTVASRGNSGIVNFTSDVALNNLQSNPVFPSNSLQSTKLETEGEGNTILHNIPEELNLQQRRNENLRYIPTFDLTRYIVILLD